MIGYSSSTNQYKTWDLTMKDIVISRDVVFIEGKLVNQTPAVFIKELRTTYESITVLPGLPEEPQQLLIPVLSECQNPGKQELAPIDPQT